MTVLYFEDIEPGHRFASGGYLVTREDIIDFASRWDPREFHMDEEAAICSPFGGLVASGAHITAICTRLSLEAYRETIPMAITAGLASENTLYHPVRPGDTLSYRGEVIELRDSDSHPDSGMVRTRHELVNQDGLTVFEMVTSALIRKRPY